MYCFIIFPFYILVIVNKAISVLPVYDTESMAERAVAIPLAQSSESLLYFRKNKAMAEREGFEPSKPFGFTRFPSVRTKPGYATSPRFGREPQVLAEAAFISYLFLAF